MSGRSRLRYGMVGGGIGSYIGDVHRHAAGIDDLAELCAGCFSRHFDVSLETAEAWGVDRDRVYHDYREMADAEAAREDGIDFVSIMTPNASHYEAAKYFMERGIHVMCDKPLTLTLDQALDLERIAKDRDLLVGVTYGYTGYPVIRQAREMIRQGVIGDILHVRVQHPEDWVIESTQDEKPEGNLPWRFQPEAVGEALCTGDLGTHAEQLLVQFTGLRIRRVLAMFDTYPTWLPLETNTTVLLDLGEGRTGDLWASQIAMGKTCSPAIYVIGTKGALEWDHTQPDILRHTPRGGATCLLEAGKGYMTPQSDRLNRVSAGHHEGFYEAFGNIYRSFAQVLLARKEGREPEDWTFPDIRDGVDGMRFVHACVESQRRGNVWVEL